MIFPDREVTPEEVEDSAKRSLRSALACSIRHWAYKTKYGYTEACGYDTCALCERYLDGRRTRRESCRRCAITLGGYSDCAERDSLYWNFVRDLTQESALDVLNMLLTIARRKTVTMGEVRGTGDA